LSQNLLITLSLTAGQDEHFITMLLIWRMLGPVYV